MFASDVAYAVVSGLVVGFALQPVWFVLVAL